MLPYSKTYRFCNTSGWIACCTEYLHIRALYSSGVALSSQVAVMSMSGAHQDIQISFLYSLGAALTSQVAALGVSGTYKVRESALCTHQQCMLAQLTALSASGRCLNGLVIGLCTFSTFLSSYVESASANVASTKAKTFTLA
jgi:hypothetical protein